MAWAAALGAGAAALLPFAQSGIDAALANEEWQRSKHVSNRQMASAQFIAENQPSWAVEGLRRAGLNPMLAGTRGVSAAEFAPRSQAPNVKAANLSGGLDSARQVARMKPELELLVQEGRRVRNEADAAFYDVGTAASRAEGEYQRARQEELRVDQVRKMTELIEEQIGGTSAAARSQRAGAALSEAELPSAKAAEELFRQYPELRMLREILRSIR